MMVLLLEYVLPGNGRFILNLAAMPPGSTDAWYSIKLYRRQKTEDARGVHERE